MKTLKLENLPMGSNVLIAYTPDVSTSKVPQENFLYRQHTDFETPVISDIKDEELIIRVRCAGDAGYYKPLEWKGYLENDNNTGIIIMAEEFQDRLISKIIFK